MLIAAGTVVIVPISPPSLYSILSLCNNGSMASYQLFHSLSIGSYQPRLNPVRSRAHQLAFGLAFCAHALACRL
jgi:hypothetical protein